MKNKILIISKSSISDQMKNICVSLHNTILSFACIRNAENSLRGHEYYKILLIDDLTLDDISLNLMNNMLPCVDFDKKRIIVL